MAERVFALPDLGEGLEEAEVSAWLVAEGDEVALNQPLAEVETAKAVVEIPSPVAGRVVRLHAKAGATVKVGDPLVSFDVEERAVPASGPRPAATPAVRKLARDLGVDLSNLRGSGPDGRITREDVERAAGSHERAAGPGAAGPGRTERAAERAAYDALPISTVRRTIAENLMRVVREVPQVTTFRTLDCSALDALRRELGVSPLPVVVRALADVCAEHRLLNASYVPEAGEIRLHRAVNVGIATDTERGLVVPVVRDVGALGIREVAAEISRLAALAREARLAPADMAGGTITVTNTGSYGSEFGTPLLTPGQGATLALGVIEPRALVMDGIVAARPACTLSLTFDHRLLDGAAAGRAFGELVAVLQSAERLARLPR